MCILLYVYIYLNKKKYKKNNNEISSFICTYTCFIYYFILFSFVLLLSFLFCLFHILYLKYLTCICIIGEEEPRSYME